MKESRGLKTFNQGYLSYIGRLRERLTSFHKDILKNYLRPLGANPLSFLKSYFGPRMFRSPVVETKPSSIYQSVEGQGEGLLLVVRRKTISSGSSNLIKTFLPKYQYIPIFVELSLHKIPKHVPILVDPQTSRAARTAKSELLPRGEEIFASDKLDLTMPKGFVPFCHTSFQVVRQNKTANIDSKVPVFPQRRSVIPSFSSNNPNLEQVYTHLDAGTPFAANTAVGGTKAHGDKWDSNIASDLPHQWLPSFPQRSKRVYPGLPPEVRPILQPKGPPLRMGRFTPMIHTKHTKIEEEALSNEREIPSSFKETDGPSLAPEFIFVNRADNASGAFQLVQIKEDRDLRGSMSNHPIGFESDGLKAPAHSSIDYGLIADRVYEIIENRLRVEKERE
jgi:hypothetical protein